jgi:hypothetical protein
MAGSLKFCEPRLLELRPKLYHLAGFLALGVCKNAMGANDFRAALLRDKTRAAKFVLNAYFI